MVCLEESKAMDIKENGLEYETDRYYGIYRGFVHSNEDPENLGRLIVSCPSVYGEEIHEYWALPKGIYAGSGVGSFWIPSKGDFIWVSFEGGDVSFPIWEYGWWGENQVPTGAKTSVKVLQTTSGHRFEINDDTGEIIVKTKDGQSTVWNAQNTILGTFGADKEPAVLGDTLHTLLNEMLSDLGNLKTIITSNGVTQAVNTASNWSWFATKWQGKFEKFKSKIVKLD